MCEREAWANWKRGSPGSPDRKLASRTRDPKRQAQRMELQTDSQKTGGFKTQERQQRGHRWHHSKFRPRKVDDKKGNMLFDGTSLTHMAQFTHL